MRQNINARTQFFLDNPSFIRSVGLKYQIPDDDLEDFIQDVLLNSLQHNCDCDDGQQIESYARQYVLIYVKKYKRGKKASRQIKERELPSSAETAEQIIEKRESWLYTQEVVRNNGYAITPRQREVMELLFAGNSIRQTARILKISKSRVYKIRTQIQRKIKKIEKKRGRKNKNYPKTPLK